MRPAPEVSPLSYLVNSYVQLRHVSKTALRRPSLYVAIEELQQNCIQDFYDTVAIDFSSDTERLIERANDRGVSEVCVLRAFNGKVKKVGKILLIKKAFLEPVTK